MMPRKVPPGPRPQITFTVRLDLTTTDERNAAQLASGLASARPGTRVELVVGDHNPTSWSRVLQLVSDAATHTNLTLDIVGSPATAHAWALELHERTLDQPLAVVQ